VIVTWNEIIAAVILASGIVTLVYGREAVLRGVTRG
jgi:hypothetical protein